MSAIEQLRALMREREQTATSLESARASTDRAREELEKRVPSLARGGEKARKAYREAKAALEEATDVQRSWACELATLDGRISDLEPRAAVEQEQLDDASWHAGVEHVGKMLDSHHELAAKKRVEIAKLEAEITASREHVAREFEAKVRPFNQVPAGPYHRPQRYIASLDELDYIKSHGAPPPPPPAPGPWDHDPFVRAHMDRLAIREASAVEIAKSREERANDQLTDEEMVALNHIIDAFREPRAVMQVLELAEDPCGRERWTFSTESVRAIRRNMDRALAMIAERNPDAAPFDAKKVAEQIRGKTEFYSRTDLVRAQREQQERKPS